MHVLAEYRYNFIQTTNLADTATNRNAYLQSSASSSGTTRVFVVVPADRATRSALRVTAGSQHRLAVSKTRRLLSVHGTSITLCTRIVRVTEYTVHILSKPWQKRATSGHHNASTTILRCRGGVVSFEKFRSCALLSLTCSCHRVKQIATVSLSFIFFCAFCHIGSLRRPTQWLAYSAP